MATHNSMKQKSSLFYIDGLDKIHAAFVKM